MLNDINNPSRHSMTADCYYRYVFDQGNSVVLRSDLRPLHLVAAMKDDESAFASVVGDQPRLVLAVPLQRHHRTQEQSLHLLISVTTYIVWIAEHR